MSQVADIATYDVLVSGSLARAEIGLTSDFRVWNDAAEAERHAKSLFVMCSASGLQSVASAVSAVNKRHQLRLLLVYSDTDPTWLPQMLERADLRAIRNMLVYQDKGLPNRILRAWKLGAQDSLIAKAAVVGERLMVMSCSAKPFDIAFGQIPALARIPDNEREIFRVADDGSYIHWPDSDVHVDIDAIRAAVDPKWSGRMAAKKVVRNKAYGAAIRSLRREAGLSQSSIKGLSERQVRRIELGESLSSESLEKFGSALGMSLAEFLSRVAKTMAGVGASGGRKVA